METNNVFFQSETQKQNLYFLFSGAPQVSFFYFYF